MHVLLCNTERQGTIWSKGKVTEQVIVKWLLHYIGDKMDYSKYGWIKGNSICNYIIEFMNFILLNQDRLKQTVVLADMVDFEGL